MSSRKMNYSAACCEVSKNATHPFVPSLEREGKPEGRGELKPTIVALLTTVVLLFSCTQFPTQFGYIGPEYVQTVGFVFSPLAEGAPGDTMHMTAYFAGQPVHTFACSLSAQYTLSMYGNDTAVNFKPLNDLNATFGPDSISLSFPIPQNFFAAGGQLIQSLLNAFPDSTKAKLGLDSVSLKGVSPSQLPLVVGAFLTSTNFSTVDTATAKLIAHLAEVLSGQMVLHLAVNGGYTIIRNITVRYNSHINGNPYVYVNHNPNPKWLAIYKVKNTGKYSFDPTVHTGSDTLICLYKDSALSPDKIGGPKLFTDTVLIDTGFSYYAMGDTGIFIYDSVTPSGSHITATDTTLDKSFSFENMITYERYSYLWFYEPDSTTPVGVKPENSVIIGNSRDYYSSFSPPLDTVIHNVDIWARASDVSNGELNRPIGVTSKKVSVVLKYSAEYAKKAKKK